MKSSKRNLPKPSKVADAKLVPGAALKAARKQYEGSTLPTGKNFPTKIVEGCK
jgi:hypothetical protein